MPNVIFNKVWQKDDLKAMRDAVSVWSAAGVLGAGIDVNERMRELCVVGYDGDDLVAISTAYVAYLPMVREVMALFRVFVVDEKRKRGLAVPLTFETHEVLRDYARSRPDLRIGGSAGIVIVRGKMHKPVTPARMVLIGYTKNDEPILVRWFDHFQIDEEAARARRGP
jgi:hypothetical protein